MRYTIAYFLPSAVDCGNGIVSDRSLPSTPRMVSRFAVRGTDGAFIARATLASKPAMLSVLSIIDGIGTFELL